MGLTTACCGRAECGGECGNEWQGEQALPRDLPAAVLALNKAWNEKQPEEVIADHLDLCRRYALATTAENAAWPKDLPIGPQEI